jgi:uncharacterized protein YchJ
MVSSTAAYRTGEKACLPLFKIVWQTRKYLSVVIAQKWRWLFFTKANETAFAGGEEEQAKPVRNKEPKVGRNAPCPCGSGKKYKNCHGLA